MFYKERKDMGGIGKEEICQVVQLLPDTASAPLQAAGMKAETVGKAIGWSAAGPGLYG